MTDQVTAAHNGPYELQSMISRGYHAQIAVDELETPRLVGQARPQSSPGKSHRTRPALCGAPASVPLLGKISGCVGRGCPRTRLLADTLTRVPNQGTQGAGTQVPGGEVPIHGLVA